MGLSGQQGRAILKWGSGVTLFLLGLGALSDGLLGVIGGLIWMLTGLLVFPRCRDLLFDLLLRAGGPDLTSTGKGVAAGLVIFGFVIGGVVVPNPAGGTQSSTSSVEGAAGTATSTRALETATTLPDPKTQAPIPAAPAGAETYRVTVTEVVDGDTMDIRFQDGTSDTIRLLGVDTPEMHSEVTPSEFGLANTENSRAWLRTWAEKATDYAQTTLAGETIRIAVDENADRRGSFGRLLVYVYTDNGTMLNRQLLQRGYARVYESSFSKRTVFEDYERIAQSENVGVWGYTSATPTPTPTPKPTDTPELSSGELEIAAVQENAEGNDHDNLNDEYVTFENTGGQALDLSGWTIKDSDGHSYSFPDGFTLDSGAQVTLYTGSGSDSETAVYWGRDSAVWNNKGDTIIVVNGDGQAVIEFEY